MNDRLCSADAFPYRAAIADGSHAVSKRRSLDVEPHSGPSLGAESAHESFAQVTGASCNQYPLTHLCTTPVFLDASPVGSHVRL